MPSSPHEFFKVFLLSSDYRLSVDRPSVDQLLTDTSVKYRWTKSYFGRDTSGTTIDRVSNECRPTIVWFSTDYRPLYRPTIDRLSTACRPTIDRVSTDCRPLYRPIDRLTLPTINMIQLTNMVSFLSAVCCNKTYSVHVLFSNWKKCQCLQIVKFND